MEGDVYINNAENGPYRTLFRAPHKTMEPLMDKR